MPRAALPAVARDGDPREVFAGGRKYAPACRSDPVDGGGSGPQVYILGEGRVRR